MLWLLIEKPRWERFGRNRVFVAVVIVVLFLLFIFLRCRHQGFGLGLTKFERPINICIELSKWHLDLGRGEILLRDTYLDPVSIKAVLKHWVYKRSSKDWMYTESVKGRAESWGIPLQRVWVGRGISKGDVEGAASEVGRKPREWGVLYVKKVSEWIERLFQVHATVQARREWKMAIEFGNVEIVGELSKTFE